MRAILAIAWKEALQIRTELAALLVIVLVSPPIVVTWKGTAGEELHAVLSAVALTLSALVLGAGLFAGDAAPRFLAGRAVGPVRGMLSRLIVRLVALLAVIAAAELAARATGFQPVSAAPAMLQAFVGMSFLGAALSSGFCTRAMTAALDGLAVGAVAMLVGIVPAAAFAAESGGAGDEGAIFDRAAAASTALLMTPAFLLVIAGVARLRRDLTVDPARLLRRAAAIVAVSLVALTLAWTFLGGAIARARLARAVEDWQREVHGSAPPPFPAQSRSMEAAAADAAARGLGLPLGAPASRAEGSQLPRLPKPLRSELSWFSVPDAGSRPVPREIVAFLGEHAAEMGELRRILARGGLRWEAENRFSGPIPDIASHVQLAKLLVAEAVVENRGPSQGSGLESLRALRELTLGLRRHPSPLSRILAASMSRWHARACRLVGAPEAWIDGEAEASLAREIAEAVEWETAQSLEVLRGRDRFSPFRPGIPPAWHVLERVLAPAEMWRASGSVRESIPFDRAIATDDACAGLLFPRPATTRPSGELDPLTMILTYPMTVRRGFSAQAEWDLTRTVRRLEEWRRVDADGTLPPAELLVSELCPDRSWQAIPQPDGSLLITSWPEAEPWRGEPGFAHVLPAR